MRIGAIFARGSCRALKWTALFGVVFALGAGSASAQITNNTNTKKWTRAEGQPFDVTFKFEGKAPAAYPGGSLEFVVFHSPTPGATTGDGQFTVSVNPRDGRPTVTEQNADLQPGVTTLNFAASGGDVQNISRTATVTLLPLADLDAEDEIGAIRVAVSAINIASGSDHITLKDDTAIAVNTTYGDIGVLTITDPHEQEFEWVKTTLVPTAAAGGPVEGAERVSIDVRTTPAPVNYVWNVQARSDNNRYPIHSDNAGVFPLAATGRTVRLDVPTSDGDRDDTEVKVSLYHGGTSQLIPLDPYTFDVKDIHSLPVASNITWKAYADKNGKPDTDAEVTSIMEGAEDAVHVTVTVARGEDPYPSGEDLEVAVMPANAGQGLDYRLEGVPLTFNRTGLTGTGATGNRKSATFKVFALADDDIGAEDLMLNLRVTGKTATNGDGEVMAAKPVSLSIEDTTTALLTHKSDEDVMAAVAAARTAAAGDDNEWTPGESFSLMESDLFNMLDDNPIDLAASSSSSAVSVSTTGDTVMLMAREVGTSTIKVTGTVTGSSLVSQTRANVATVEFNVDVDELDLAITLSGPEDMNIAEGMSAMVTATANRAVGANTMVELVGTGGTASPGDWSAEDIMIMAGEMTGTTMLMANEDSMEESMETLTIEGRSGSMKTNMLTFNLWDAAVPALPVIAQLLLAAFLAIGGYRRYLRR